VTDKPVRNPVAEGIPTTAFPVLQRRNADTSGFGRTWAIPWKAGQNRQAGLNVSATQ